MSNCHAAAHANIALPKRTVQFLCSAHSRPAHRLKGQWFAVIRPAAFDRHPAPTLLCPAAPLLKTLVAPNENPAPVNRATWPSRTAAAGVKTPLGIRINRHRLFVGLGRRRIAGGVEFVTFVLSRHPVSLPRIRGSVASLNGNWITILNKDVPDERVAPRRRFPGRTVMLRR